MTQPHFGYASTRDIHAIYGLSMNAIYTAAHRHHWRRIRYGRHTLYYWHDVHDTCTALDKRP